MEKTFSKEETALAWWESLPHEGVVSLYKDHSLIDPVTIKEIVSIWEDKKGEKPVGDSGVLNKSTFWFGDSSIDDKVDVYKGSIVVGTVGRELAELIESASSLKEENERLKEQVRELQAKVYKYENPLSNTK